MFAGKREDLSKNQSGGKDASVTRLENYGMYGSHVRTYKKNKR